MYTPTVVWKCNAKSKLGAPTLWPHNVIVSNVEMSILLLRCQSFWPVGPWPSFKIHSLKLTYPLTMVVSNRNLLFQGSIFSCYVSFREGKTHDIPWFSSHHMLRDFSHHMVLPSLAVVKVSRPSNHRPIQLVRTNGCNKRRCGIYYLGKGLEQA